MVMVKGNKCVIKIKMHTDKIEKPKVVSNGDWVDLRAARGYELKKGEFKLINLGCSVKLPDGYEMILAARSSTFVKYGLIQTNGIGVIDESYSSDDDVLKMPVYATRDTKIKAGDRICQFRIIKHQPELIFEEVETLGNDIRGGFGSTGRN